MPVALIITVALGLALAASTATILLASDTATTTSPPPTPACDTAWRPGQVRSPGSVPSAPMSASRSPRTAARRTRAAPTAGSLERHRLAWLYLLNETDLLSGMQPRRMLHLAPRAPLWRKFAAVPAIEYLSADPDPGRAVVQLTRLISSTTTTRSTSSTAVSCSIESPRRSGKCPSFSASCGREDGRFCRCRHAAGSGALSDRAGRGRLPGHADAYVRRLPSPAAITTASSRTQRSTWPASPRLVAPAGCGASGATRTELLDSVAIPGAQPLVLGRVEQVQDGVVSGWAWSPAARSGASPYASSLDGERVGAAVADLPRPSLSATGIGDGAHGFRIALPPELASRVARSARRRRERRGAGTGSGL